MRFLHRRSPHHEGDVSISFLPSQPCARAAPGLLRHLRNGGSHAPTEPKFDNLTKSMKSVRRPSLSRCRACTRKSGRPSRQEPRLQEDHPELGAGQGEAHARRARWQGRQTHCALATRLRTSWSSRKIHEAFGGRAKVFISRRRSAGHGKLAVVLNVGRPRDGRLRPDGNLAGDLAQHLSPATGWAPSAPSCPTSKRAWREDGELEVKGPGVFQRLLAEARRRRSSPATAGSRPATSARSKTASSASRTARKS